LALAPVSSSDTAENNLELDSYATHLGEATLVTKENTKDLNKWFPTESKAKFERNDRLAFGKPRITMFCMTGGRISNSYLWFLDYNGNNMKMVDVANAFAKTPIK
jgi:hypothetical protein